MIESWCFYSKSHSGDTLVQCFVYLFIPLLSKTPSFESLEDCLPEMLSKLGVLAGWGIMTPAQDPKQRFFINTWWRAHS